MQYTRVTTQSLHSKKRVIANSMNAGNVCEEVRASITPPGVEQNQIYSSDPLCTHTQGVTDHDHQHNTNDHASLTVLILIHRQLQHRFRLRRWLLWRRVVHNHPVVFVLNEYGLMLWLWLQIVIWPCWPLYRKRDVAFREEGLTIRNTRYCNDCNQHDGNECAQDG